MSPSNAEPQGASPELIGRRLHTWSTDVASTLGESLEDEFELVTEKGEFGYRLELVVFCSFAVDSLVESLLGHWEEGVFSEEEVQQVRSHMRRQLLDTLFSNFKKSGSRSGQQSKLQKLIVDRFEEYREAFERTRSNTRGVNQKENGNHLGRVACRRITGKQEVDDDIATVLLSGFSEVTERLAPLMKLPAAGLSDKETSTSLSAVEKKAMFAFRLRRFQAKRGHLHGLDDLAPRYMAELEEKVDLPECSSCGKYLFRPGRDGSWSWEWLWADNFSRDGTCWDCTPRYWRVLSIGLLLLLLVLMTTVFIEVR